MSPFSSITMDRSMCCFLLKIGRWNSDLPLRLSEYHHFTSGLVLFTTWHCWALNGDKWRGRHLLLCNFVSLWSTEFFLNAAVVSLQPIFFFLLSFVGDVNKYSQLIAAVYHRINSRDFRIQVFQDYWTKNQPTPIENMKHIYWYFDFYLHSLKLT